MEEPKTPEQVKPEKFSETGVLKLHFGDQWKLWAWLRTQFTPASLSIMGSVIVAAAGYIGYLRENIAKVETRVLVLETRVVPIVEQGGKSAVVTEQIEDLKDRVGRLEAAWDNASTVASTPNEKLVKKRHH